MVKKPSKSSGVGGSLISNPRFQAFLFLIAAGIVLSLAQLFRTRMIEDRYSNPAPLFTFSTIFSFTAFSLVPFIFHWSLKTFRKRIVPRVIAVLAAVVLFSVVYLFLLSAVT